jgi:pimeloyl-ACP methyl ester carboxylesterase
MSRTRTTALLAATVVALGAAGACGSEPAAAPEPPTARSTSTSAPATTSTTVERPTALRDELVEVRGARMHLHCEGAGAPTVLLLAGFTDGGDAWGSLQTAMTAQTRVCSYARFGTGTSDPAPTAQTFATEADDLRTMLDTAGEPGPYVLVGHSFGGPEAVTFADQYADDVTGLMLIDASPAGWYDAVCSVPDDGSDDANTFGELCASLTDPAANPERLDAAAAFTGVGNVDSLGDLPMVVVTVAQRSYTGVAASDVEGLTEIWIAGQADWAALSTASKVVPVDGVGHYIHLERPWLVTELLEGLLP